MATYPDSKSDTDDATDVRPDRRSPPRAPRWVKVFGIIALVLILLLVVQLLMGGGNHGPGRHKMSGDAGGHTLSASVAEGHTPAEMYVSSVAPSRMEPLTTTRDRGDAP